MKRIICFIIAGLLALTTVYAMDSGVSYNENTYTVTLKGTSESAFSVTVKEGTLPFSREDKPLYTRVFETIGDYNISVPLPSDIAENNGKIYSVYINGELSGTFTYIDVSARSELIKNLSVSSSEELETIINENKTLLGIEEISSSQAGILYTRFPFNDVADFSLKLKYAKVLDQLNKGNADKNLLIENDNLFTANLEEDFGEFTDAGAKKLVSLLSALDYSEKTFDEQYNDKKIAALCYDVEHWSELAEILRSGIISGIDRNDSSINKIAEAMILERDEFTSSKAVADCYNQIKLTINQPSAAPSAPAGKPSGGGGGGGGGGFSVAPAVTENKTEVYETFKFDDIEDYTWAENSIYNLKDKGIISGVSERLFAPERNITRAEFSKLISEVFGLASGKCSFSDVLANSWYYPYVGACANAGIILGDGEKFNPDESVSRQDAAVMIYRALTKNGNTLQGSYYFADEEMISDYAKEAVALLGANDIIKGVGNSRFAPLDNINRASAAVLIFNTMNNYIN